MALRASFGPAIVFSALLAACGGGGGSVGSTATATPPPAADTGSATSYGTITGFGSVIVDGTRIDDHSVLAAFEKEDGTLVPTELKIGQQVAATHDGNHVASSIRVTPNVHGTVDAVNVSGGSLTVLGQAITVNTDATAGPVTVFESPYSSLADVKAGDFVEVHAIPRVDGAGKSALQATRIAKASADGVLRTSGIVSNLSASAKTFSLGNLVIDYSQARLLPDGVTLANGLEVHVAIPLGSVAGTTPVKATVVKATLHTGDSHSKPSEIGGAVASVDTGAKSFRIGGVTVDASAANFPQNGKSFADVKAGSYVVATGVYDASGVLKAQQVVLRGAPEVQQDGSAELHGTVLNFNSMADFTVRDVHVDAGAAKIDASCGQLTQLANGLQVGVKGTLQPSGIVKAAAIVCEQPKDGQSIVGANGTAGAVDAAARTFTLTGEKATVSVKWTDATVFVRGDASKLAGAKVEVQGTVSAGVLTASKIVVTGKI